MLLAINTSTQQFSLALLSEDGALLSEHVMSEENRHFGNLMPTLHFILNASKSDIREVKCISVAAGPGSFTGLRIGLSLAKGLCHALQVPIVGVSSLEAMARQLPHTAFPIIPILHSRKGEVFTARFIWDTDSQLIRTVEDTWVKFDDFPSLFQKTAMFIGNNYPSQAPLLKDLLGDRALLAPAHCWVLRASSIGLSALDKFLRHDLDDLYNLNPVYLRPPDIRPNPFSLLYKSKE